jgi:hypothetical protein
MQAGFLARPGLIACAMWLTPQAVRGRVARKRGGLAALSRM